MRTNVQWWTLIGTQYDEYREIYSPNDNICPYYIINRYGDIYSRFSGIYIKQITTDKGYKVVSLDTIEGNRIQRRVHRLVMTTFKYFPRCEKFEVDHIYGNKADNFVDHLDWVTGKENTNRAINLGLKQSWSGESNPKSILTNDEAILAAQMASQGSSDEEILSAIPNLTYYMLQHIIQGKTWNIPKELIDQIHIVRHPTIVSESDKHRICKWFQDNNIKNIYNNPYKGMKQDYINLAISSLNLENNMSVFRIVKRLFYRHQDNDITSLYNY
jgi:hypothetical protein